MRDIAAIAADAAAGSPFSNGTAWEVWADNVCGQGSGCVHDSTYGTADADVDCPLITTALMQLTPKEWTERTDRVAIDAQQYNCTEYEEYVATSTEDGPEDDNPDENYDGEPRWRPVEVLPTQEGLF